MTERTRSAAAAPTLVVGVGASAGGIGACQQFLENAPPDAGIAYVIIQHLAPDKESRIADILEKVTELEVSQVSSDQPIEANHVYVIAPGIALSVGDGMLVVGAPEEPHFSATPIDAFFSSLAESYGERAAGVVLSGTGHDGSAGLARIHAAGGLCLAQQPGTADFGEMPKSAIDTGAADAVLEPGEMGEPLRAFAVDQTRPAPTEQPEQPPEPQTAEPLSGLDGVLDLLGERYGVDFRHHYRRGTLERRTRRRMDIEQISSWSEYLALLGKSPEEVEALYSDVLIDVTEFFRDSEHWRYLEEEVVPELIEQHDDDTPIRLWSAGCATGEEAYGLAMTFIEQIERQGRRLRLRVFGSDVSHEALAFARRGLYPARIEEQVSEVRLRRFFDRVGDGYQVKRALRDTVTFASHDLLSDPPFAKLDLVSCRNVLIYLEPHAQRRVLEVFHFALRPRGLLWLGTSETIGRRTELFETGAGKHRLYRALVATRLERGPTESWSGRRASLPGHGTASVPPPKDPKVVRRLEQFVLHRYTSACVAINRNAEILYFFGPTDDYLEQPKGPARMDLLSWARPGLYAKLRRGIAEAIEHERKLTISDLRIERDSSVAQVEATIEPVSLGAEPSGLFIVSFCDVLKPPARLAATDVDELPVTHQLERELRDTRLELENSVEQLETTNEEFRASHEELLSLNEELQSSNEELETSKEELQSVNEELTTINAQLEERNTTLHTLTSDINNLLVSSAVPTLLLDSDCRIRRFTPASAAVMRIDTLDVGQRLDPRVLHVQDDELFSDVRRVLDEHVTIDAEVQTDRGQWFVRRVLPYRTEDQRVDGVCVTFQDVTPQKLAAAESEEARSYAEGIIRASRTPILVLDSGFQVVSANIAFYDLFEVSEEDTTGRRVFDLGNGQWDIPRLRTLIEEILPREREIRGYDVEHEFEGIGWRVMRLNGHVMTRANTPDLILMSIEDVTDLRHAQMTAESRSDDLTRDHRRKDEFLAMLGHELRNPLAALVNAVEIIRTTAGLPRSVEQIGPLMSRQVKRITSMLDQLLDVGRVITGKLELARDAVDLADAAKAAVEAVTPLLDSAEQELSLTLPEPGEAMVLGDGLRLVQVIENLLGNASKYTEDHGHIWLAIEISDDRVKLSVRDTGVGMEPGVLAHAFELFSQAPQSLHRAKGGLGLGLALVRTIVNMHRGHVEAHSAGPGRGTEMIVSLRRLRQVGISPPEADGQLEELVAGSGRSVLIVEDERDAATTLVELLASRGHEAKAVHDGFAALEALRESQPDVVLLDLGLPEIDGYEVAARIRKEHGKGLMLVAMTGYQRDEERLTAAGFDDHMLKPPELERLLSILSSADRGGDVANGQGPPG